MNRYSWRKKYELMVPSMLIGPGRSFGELAVQKSSSNKIKATRTRQATILCRTDCKFAVLTQADYQAMLDNVDRRRLDK